MHCIPSSFRRTVLSCIYALCLLTQQCTVQTVKTHDSSFLIEDVPALTTLCRRLRDAKWNPKCSKLPFRTSLSAIKRLPLALRGGRGGSYYDILGLDNGSASTAEDIKRAYKKAALKWHPDRVKPAMKIEAEAKFKKISEAYEVLSDPHKKAFYDQHGDEGVRSRQHSGYGDGFSAGHAGTDSMDAESYSFGGGQGIPPEFVFTDPFDLFARFFSNDVDPFAGAPRRGRGGLRTDMFGSTVFEGPGFHFAIGQPSLTAFAVNMISQMVGAWAATRSNARSAPSARQVRVPLECTLEELAGGCAKTVAGPDGQDLTVQVQPGWKAGTRVIFCVAGGGGAAAEEEEGGVADGAMEVVVVIEEAPHPVFVREGDHLRWNCRITPSQAHEGTAVTLPRFDIVPGGGGGGGGGDGAGGERKLRLRRRVEDGEVVRVRGAGMPVRGGPARGDLLVTVLVAPWFESAAVRASEMAWFGLEWAGRRAWTRARRFAGWAARAAERYVVEPVRRSDWARKVVPPVLTFVILYMFNPVYAYMQLIITVFAALGESRPGMARR